MRIVISYGVGYGRHTDEIEVEDNSTDEEIEKDVEEAVMQHFNWSWKRAE